MKQARSVIHKSLLWLTLVASWLAMPSRADEFTDVNQLVRTNQFAEALVKADSYLVNKPADPQMRFIKGVIQRQLGKQAEAIATFASLTQDYPELAEPYNNLAALYAAQGQLDQARAALEMAIRTNPNYAIAHENLGDVYALLASEAYNKTLQLDKGNTSVPPKLAVIGEILKLNIAGAGQPPVAPASKP